MRALVPLAARRSHRVIADSESTRRDLERYLDVPRDKVDVVPLGHRRIAGRDARARGRAAPSPRPGRPPGAADGVRQAARQEPEAPDRRARADPGRASPGAGRCPGYATPYEDELQASTPPRRASATTCAGSAGRATPSSRACTRSPPCSCSRRSTRGSGCRCSRRCAAACRSRARTARRCPRWQATPRCCSTPRTRARSQAPIERILSDPAEAELMRAAGRAQAERFTWRATARGTLASYDRALRPA